MCELVFLAAAATPDLLRSLPWFLFLYATAFAAYLLAWRWVRGHGDDARVTRAVLVAAVVFRATTLSSPASLSDDVHRFVWDGAVLASGENPYTFAPADPRRDRFRALAQNVNHPQVSTIYPPLLELIFAAAATVSPSARSVRVAMVLCEILVWLGLHRLLRARRRPTSEILGFAWCPLAVFETAGSGHVEVLGIGLLLLGLSHLSDGRKNLSMWLFAASALSKYFALAVVVACARRLGLARVLGVLALFGVAYLPFVGAGAGLVRGLFTFARHWHFNAPIYSATVWAWAETGATGAAKSVITWWRSRVFDAPGVERLYEHVYPHEVSRLLLSLVFAVLVAREWKRGRDPIAAAALLAFAFLALTPTLHPWYVLWGVAFAVVVGSPPVIALAATVPLSYAAAASQARGLGWREPMGVLVAEFLPVLIVLAWSLRGRAAVAAIAPVCARAPTLTSRSSRAARPSARAAHAFQMPPSPFKPRPLWKRFREDSWPRLRTAGESFWASGYRWPVVGLVGVAVAIAVFASVRRLDGVSGTLVREGAPVVGAKVDVLWYSTRREAVPLMGKMGPVEGRYVDVLEGEREVRTAVVTSDGDGRFEAGGGVALVWPTSAGPFVRLRVRAPDPISGQEYPVRQLRLGDGRQVHGGIELGSGANTKDGVGTIELLPPGRILDIDVAGDLILTAEDEGGARLYRVASDALVATAHRPSEHGERVRAAALVGDAGLVSRGQRLELVRLESGLPIVSSVEGDFGRLVQATPVRLVMTVASGLDFLRTADLAEPFDHVALGDEDRDGLTIGPDLIDLEGAILVYLHSDGSLRLSDIDSGFRTPAVLSDLGGRTVGFARVRGGSGLLVASRNGVTLYDIEHPAATHRLGRLELPGVGVLALRGPWVLGESAVVEVVVTGDSVSEKQRIALPSGETEAVSAQVLGGSLVLPRVDEPRLRTESLGTTRDPILGTLKEQTVRRLESVRLTGLLVIDLATAAVREVTIEPPFRAAVRQDGLNRGLVCAPLGDGAVIVAGEDTRLRRIAVVSR